MLVLSKKRGDGYCCITAQRLVPTRQSRWRDF
nr:MAG TPA: hypothetical protein [Caudoviricetes sp.]